MSNSRLVLHSVSIITLMVGLTVSTFALAAFSSQSPLIAFTRGEGRTQEIVVYDLETRTELCFTDNKVWDGLPTLSSSGRLLAFVRATPDRDELRKPDFILRETDEIIVVDSKSGDTICIGRSDHTEAYELGRCAEYWPHLPPLAGVMNLCWTQDEAAILFEAPCSITSDLILRMDVPSGEIHILCLGNDLRPLGQNRFLIWRHKYDAIGGHDRCYIIDSWGTLTSPASHGD